MSKPPASRACRVPRSVERFQRALELIPGGTQLISRRPTRFANGVSPIYAARAKGARFWDIDGHEYIDWVSGIAAILQGIMKRVVDGTAASAQAIDAGRRAKPMAELAWRYAQKVL